MTGPVAAGRTFADSSGKASVTASASSSASAGGAPSPSAKAETVAFASASAFDGASLLIDATSLPPKLGGVGRYIEGLLQGCAELGLEPWVVAKPMHLEHLRAVCPDARVVPSPGWIGARRARFLWEQVGLPRLARRLGADVIHSPHYTFPLRWRGHRVVTLHDATMFTDPAAHSRLKAVFFGWWIRRGYRSDVTLIAPSRATVDAISAHIGQPRHPVYVAHHGVDAEVFHEPTADEIAAFRQRVGLGPAERWVAFLGTIEPRKQVPRLLRAVAELRAKDAAFPRLLVGGQRGWDAEAVAMLDARPDGVTELGYLELDELRALLGGAELVVYPSIAEGFGLPVLEAMACGAPVLTTPVTALPEVGGDVAAYTSEAEAGDLAPTMRALLDDEPGRRAMAAQGPVRAAEFTWRAAAAVHVEAYRARPLGRARRKRA